MSSIGNASSRSTLDPNKKSLQILTPMMIAGFEGGHSMNQKNLELARSKFLLDKLTGKLPAELRGGLATRLPPLEKLERDRAVLQQSPSPI